MKRIAGAAALARLKSSATALSESPTYGEKISAAEAERKAQPVPEAAARTSFVLPQPGGPYSRQPLIGELECVHCKFIRQIASSDCWVDYLQLLRIINRLLLGKN